MPSPDRDQLYHIAERLFLQREAADQILQALDQPSEPDSQPNRFQALTKFIADGQASSPFVVPPKQRAAFCRFLSNTAPAYAPRLAAAASSSLVQTREGTGCKIILRPSRADDRHLYVVITLTQDSKAERPQVLLLLDAEGTISRFPLPAADENVYQMLVETDSDLVQKLSRPETEVFLH